MCRQEDLNIMEKPLLEKQACPDRVDKIKIRRRIVNITIH